MSRDRHPTVTHKTAPPHALLKASPTFPRGWQHASTKHNRVHETGSTNQQAPLRLLFTPPSPKGLSCCGYPSSTPSF